MNAFATLDFSEGESQLLIDVIADWQIVDSGPGTPKLNEFTRLRVVGAEIDGVRFFPWDLPATLAQYAPQLTIDNPAIQWLDEEGNPL